MVEEEVDDDSRAALGGLGAARCACFVVPQRRCVNIHNIVHCAGIDGWVYKH